MFIFLLLLTFDGGYQLLTRVTHVLYTQKDSLMFDNCFVIDDGCQHGPITANTLNLLVDFEDVAFPSLPVMVF